MSAKAAAPPLGGFLETDRAKLIMCVVGVVGSLLVYGVLQVGAESGVALANRLFFDLSAFLRSPSRPFDRPITDNPQQQERTVTIPFGEGEGAELFKFSLFLVLCNRLVACAISATTLLVSLLVVGGGGVHCDWCCSV